jgi:hypothetical protein
MHIQYVLRSERVGGHCFVSAVWAGAVFQHIYCILQQHKYLGVLLHIPPPFLSLLGWGGGGVGGLGILVPYNTPIAYYKPSTFVSASYWLRFTLIFRLYFVDF